MRCMLHNCMEKHYSTSKVCKYTSRYLPRIHLDKYLSTFYYGGNILIRRTSNHWMYLHRKNSTYTLVQPYCYGMAYISLMQCHPRNVRDMNPDTHHLCWDARSSLYYRTDNLKFLLHYTSCNRRDFL